MSAIQVMACIGLAFGAAVVAFNAFMLYRNEHVYKYRLWVNDTMPFEYYDRLPSYGTMHWQLFRWDWDDYLELDH